MDDKIIYALNTTIPTESFKGQIQTEGQCSDLYKKLSDSHKQRENAIKNCIIVAADKVKELKHDRDQNREDITIDKNFKSEQRKVKIFFFMIKFNIY